MATFTELGRPQVVTQDGIVTAFVLERASPDFMLYYLVRGTAAARYASTVDSTEVVGREVKDLIVFPFSTLL